MILIKAEKKMSPLTKVSFILEDSPELNCKILKDELRISPIMLLTLRTFPKNRKYTEADSVKFHAAS